MHNGDIYEIYLPWLDETISCYLVTTETEFRDITADGVNTATAVRRTITLRESGFTVLDNGTGK